MTKKKAQNIIAILKQNYGDISSDLLYGNLYELSISVVLSAQTTDKQVNTVTPMLFKKYPDFKHLSKAKTSDIEKIIKKVGLYRTKAGNIVNLSKEIVNNHNNQVPSTLEELIKLPGIGRKSANIILQFGFDKPAFPVDTHVKRIAYRIGFKKSNNPFEIEKALTGYIDRNEWKIAHLLFIYHGRNICKARKPQCCECSIRYFCEQNDVPDNIS